MKDEPLKNELLGDCLADIATPAFRASLLGEMLQSARHQRVRRRRNRVLLAAACVVATLALIEFLPRKATSGALAETNPMIAHSAPLDPAMIVTTRAEGFGIVETSRANLEVVQDLAMEKSLELIGDSALLALLDGRPAVLVHHRDLDAELVLVNPDDRAGFVVR